MARKVSSQPEPFNRFLETLEAGRASGIARGQRDSAELARMRAFVRNRYADAIPVLSRTDRDGTIYDYFRIENQPAARIHHLKPATPPPAGFLGAGQVGLQFKQPDAAGETAGLVPIRRLTLADLARAGTLDRFLHKRGRRRRSQLRAAEAAAPRTPDPSHRWADAWASIPNTGAVSRLNIWRPQLPEGQIFSLSQMWCVAQGPNGRQTAEVGWHVNPSVTGHDQPAIFCYWTGDGYATPTSYNGHNGDFLFHGSDTVLGVPITDISVAGGAQIDVYCALKLYEGNWWVYVGGDQDANAIGYFPGTLYNGGPLASGAAEVDFGGEVCGGPPFAPMGSGAFATAGQNQAAYQRNLGVWAANTKLQTSLDLQIDEADAGAYTGSLGDSDSWGNYLYFGGPGGN
jgi:hypothetical protein